MILDPRSAPVGGIAAYVLRRRGDPAWPASIMLRQAAAVQRNPQFSRNLPQRLAAA